MIYIYIYVPTVFYFSMVPNRSCLNSCHSVSHVGNGNLETQKLSRKNGGGFAHGEGTIGVFVFGNNQWIGSRSIFYTGLEHFDFASKLMFFSSIFSSKK